jgi:hypothetical protein
MRHERGPDGPLLCAAQGSGSVPRIQLSVVLALYTKFSARTGFEAPWHSGQALRRSAPSVQSANGFLTSELCRPIGRGPGGERAVCSEDGGGPSARVSRASAPRPERGRLAARRGRGSGFISSGTVRPASAGAVLEVPSETGAASAPEVGGVVTRARSGRTARASSVSSIARTSADRRDGLGHPATASPSAASPRGRQQRVPGEAAPGGADGG